MSIIIATNNKDKIGEILKVVGNTGYEFLSLSDVGIESDPEETGSTFLENAIIKVEAAREKALKLGLDHHYIMADDSGLCVDALDGAPGVYSARYAGVNGEHPTYADNNIKLLDVMKDIPEDKRTAHFETAAVVICPDGTQKYAIGKIFGKIALSIRGTNGFGYDPLFIPDTKEGLIDNPNNLTMAEFPNEVKDQVSHRAQAFRKLFEAGF